MFIMGQIPKVTANALKRVAGVSGRQHKKVPWHSTTIIVKQILPMNDFMTLVKHIIDDCSNEDEGVAVGLVDFAFKVNVVASYAFIELPKDINDAYYIIYVSDLFDTICNAINRNQLNAIVNAIEGITGVRVWKQPD